MQPYHGYDDSDSSDEDEEPSLHVRGREPPATEKFIQAITKKSLNGVRLVYQSSSASGKKIQRGSLPTFRLAEYFHKLETTSLGTVIMATSKVASTQDLMKQFASAVPPGVVLVADKQKKGRGRGGNVWTSPKGCLMFSFNIQIWNATTLPFLQYVVALSIAQGIQSEAKLCLLSHGQAAAAQGAAMVCRIKWPNDIYSGNLKLGGVICESTYDMDTKLYNVTVGCGINVSNAKPTVCVQSAIRERASELRSSGVGTQRPTHMASPLATRESILGAVLNEMERNMEVFKSSGFAPLKPEYLKHWMHSHQQVELVEPTGRTTMLIRGLTESGYLLAVDKKGVPYELHPDGNSLDFFNGLVRKKL